MAIAELSDIVKRLEKGDAALDESLTLFERGVELTKICSGLLDGAEQKVNILLKSQVGEITEQPFTIAGEEKTDE